MDKKRLESVWNIIGDRTFQRKMRLFVSICGKAVLSSKSQFDPVKGHTQPMGAARFKPSAQFILWKDYRIYDVSEKKEIQSMHIKFSSKDPNHKLTDMRLWNSSWVKNLPVRPVTPRRKTPGQLYTIYNDHLGKTR